jgi:hypothetical protein
VHSPAFQLKREMTRSDVGPHSLIPIRCRGSWVDVRVRPGFALVYVNGRYAGTAQQFTKPFRPLRVGVGPQHLEFRAPGYRTVSFWVNGDTAKLTTATGTLVKTP